MTPVRRPRLFRDHKAPLAAFVLVAVSCLVMVTHVARSDAAPGWVKAGLGIAASQRVLTSDPLELVRPAPAPTPAAAPAAPVAPAPASLTARPTPSPAPAPAAGAGRAEQVRTVAAHPPAPAPAGTLHAAQGVAAHGSVEHATGHATEHATEHATGHVRGQLPGHSASAPGHRDDHAGPGRHQGHRPPLPTVSHLVRGLHGSGLPAAARGGAEHGHGASHGHGGKSPGHGANHDHGKSHGRSHGASHGHGSRSHGHSGSHGHHGHGRH